MPKRRHIREPARDVPVFSKYDVVVVGGGIAGVAASVALRCQAVVDASGDADVCACAGEPMVTCDTNVAARTLKGTADAL